MTADIKEIREGVDERLKKLEFTPVEKKWMREVANHKDGGKAPPSSPPKSGPTDAILPTSATPMVKRSSSAVHSNAPQKRSQKKAKKAGIAAFFNPR